MWMLVLSAALAEPPSEEVCVRVARTAQDVVVERSPEAITDLRTSLVHRLDEGPLPEVSVAELMGALPVPPIGGVEPYEGGFTLQAGAIRDPTDPERVVLSVRSQAPDAALAPLRLTLVIDASPSMDSVYMRALPALQDTPPDGAYRPVTRLELAQATLRALVDRLPDRAVVSVVGLDRGHGQLLLPPTPITQAPRIHRAILQAHPIRLKTARALDVIEQTTMGGDPCADTRVLMLTDADANLHGKPGEVQERVQAWYEDGVSLWTMSLGVFDDDTSQAEAITALGGGLHLRADVLSDAVGQLTQALRASGVVGRDLSVSLTTEAPVERIDGGTQLDWQHNEVMADQTVGATYLLTVPETETGPVATVDWAVSSGFPGDWSVTDQLEITPVPAAEGPPWLRDRLVALLVAEALADREQTDWQALTELTGDLAGPIGPAREMAAWARRLAPGGAHVGGLPFDPTDLPPPADDPVERDWLELVRRASRIDGDHLLDPDVGPEVERLCEAGIDLACDAGAWMDPFDLTEASELVLPACEAGDAVACLVVGWHEQRVDSTREPVHYRAACAAGLARGCTELGRAMIAGRGVPRDRQGAAAVLTPLCKAGEGQACLSLAAVSAAPDRPALYQRAAELGSPGGDERLADLADDPRERAEALARACDAGRPSACIDLATLRSADDPDAAMAAVEAGCRLASPGACARVALRRAELGTGTLEEARGALQEACDLGDDTSCWLDALLETGTPPRAWTPTTLPDLQRNSLKADLREVVHGCFLERQWRGPARGGLEVLVQLGPQGALEGATTRGRWADEALSQCVSEQARELGEARFRDPHAARELLSYRLDHQAEVSLRATDTRDAPDVSDALEILRSRGVALDACVFEAEEHDPLDLTLDVKIGRWGEIRRHRVRTSTLNDQLDACAIEVLSERSETRLGGPVVGTVQIGFFEPADPDRRAAEVQPRAPWTGEASTLRVLALVAERHKSPHGSARLRRDNRREITDAHDDFAAFVSTHTGGQVQVQTEVRVIEGDAHVVLLDEELDTPRWLPGEAITLEERAEKGISDDEELEWTHTALRFLVSPGDLSPEVHAAVQPGQWDLVVLWIPMPWAEVPELMTHWDDHHLAGASFGALPVYPAGADLQALLKVTLPLLSARAGSRFEVPERLLPVWLDDGRYFDARSWSDYAHPLAWYGWVFAEAVPPEFWTGATARPRLLPETPTNVAPQATPSSSRDVARADELVDTVLSVPWTAAGARQESIAARPWEGTWFGLTWDRMQVLDRVVAHLEGVEAATLEITTDGETWTPVAQVAPVASPEAVFSFPPTPVFSLRVRVDVEVPGEPVRCQEIEAHTVPSSP